MNIKHGAAAWLLLSSLMSGQALVAIANPVTLTVDTSASALGGVPLTGAILADFDRGAQSLTFSAGSIISPAADLSGSGVIPTAIVYNVGSVTATASGTYQTNVSGLSLDLLSGTVVNGSAASIPLWSTSGSGTLFGTLDVELNVFGSVSNTTVNFSALLTPATAGGSGTVGLAANVAGITLSLPFELSIAVSDLDISGGGLASEVFEAVSSFLDALTAPIVVPDGLLIASNAVAVPEPATLALLGLALAACLVFLWRPHRYPSLSPDLRQSPHWPLCIKSLR